MGTPANPRPFDASNDIELYPILYWEEEDGDSYNVYFGTVESDVENRSSGTLVEAANTTKLYQCDVLTKGTTYYWAIDTVIGAVTTEGDVWDFTVDHTPWIIDWHGPVDEILSFNTEIMQPSSRIEQRVAKRLGIPRRIFSVNTQIVLADFREFEAVLSKWAKRRWPIPLWTECVEYTGTLAAIATTLTIDTQYTSFTANKYALVWQEDQWEIVVVKTVATGSLTLVEGLANTYTGTSWIVPCKFGYIQELLSVDDRPEIKTYRGRWIDDTLVDITGFTADVSYDGYTVIDDASLLSQDVTPRAENPDIFFHDYQTGPYAVVSDGTYNETMQKHAWRKESRQVIWELRQFFHDVKGNQVSFLVPTYRPDLVLSRAAGSADVIVYATDEQYTPNMTARLRNYVAFYPTGSVVVREVSAISDAGVDEAFALDAVVGADYAIGTYMCWTDKCRIADGEITLHWEYQNSVTCSVSLVRV